MKQVGVRNLIHLEKRSLNFSQPRGEEGGEVILLLWSGLVMLSHKFKDKNGQHVE